MSADRRNPFSTRAVVTAAVALAVAVGGVIGVRTLVGGEGPALFDGAIEAAFPADVWTAETARAWAEAWSEHDTDAMHALVAAPAVDLAEGVASFRGGLRITGLRASPRTPVLDGDAATVVLDVAADLESLGTWVFSTTVSLTLPPDAPTPGEWKVVWSRAALHPELTGDRFLSVTRDFGPRGELLAADGSRLTGSLVGRVGTAEADGDGRLAGDPVGTSGLQAGFDDELGGSPSGDVHVVEDGAVAGVLAHIPGRAPQSVRTSIDPRAQSVLEAQLAGLLVPAPATEPPDDESAPPPPPAEPAMVSPNAAVVLLRPSTGEVVAVASNPPQGFNRALSGRYPPGSTFKVVTSTALLTSGITPDSPASCPEVAVVGGREFRNAEGAALGDIPFRRAFYESCNTAFVQLAAGLEPHELLDAAARYGFNAPTGLEVPAEESSVPEPTGVVDQVSASIGQGRVLVTPLQMATVAATVASGAHRSPTLRAADAPIAGTPLPDGVAATLRELMRLVVAQGTGTRAQLPGEPVHGKTGTAEFGTERPPHTHAWFIGFRGDLAIAVVVEDAGFGGSVAAPVAREVFRQLG